MAHAAIGIEALHSIAAPLRAYGPVVLAGCDEPHAELMALVWGPRFDREHAQRLRQLIVRHQTR